MGQQVSKYALVKDGSVQNIIVVEDAAFLAHIQADYDAIVQYDNLPPDQQMINIGDAYDGVKFTPAPVAPVNKFGSAVLKNGVAVVQSKSVSADSIIILSSAKLSNPGFMSVSQQVDGSFSIVSSNPLDSSVVNWTIAG